MAGKVKEHVLDGTEGIGAQAEALRIAERWLVKQGWKFTPADVGNRAREILAALSQQTGSGGTGE